MYAGKLVGIMRRDFNISLTEIVKMLSVVCGVETITEN
jgi:hypothetical protein